MTLDNITPEELELIRIKREQEALANAEKVAKDNLYISECIERNKKDIAREEAKDKEQHDACIVFLNSLQKLSNRYTLGSSTFERKKSVYHPTTRDIVCVQDYTNTYWYITLPSVWGTLKISIDEKFVSLSKWSTRGQSKGYHMKISGPGLKWSDESRWYKNVKTVHEKLQDVLDTLKAQDDAKKAKQSALAWAEAKLTELYPDAVVRTGYDFERPFGSSRLGKQYDTVLIQLPNGINSMYRVWADKQLSRISITFPGEKDTFGILELLSKLEFPQIDNNENK